MTSSTIDRFNGINGGLAIKAPCRAATTANITLSGEQTIDGIAIVAGDRVLVKDQSTGADNGIYEASTSAWSRSADFDGNNDIVTGTLVFVISGTLNSTSFWRVATSGSITVGTTSITFTQTNNQLVGVSAFMSTLLDDTTAGAALTTLGVSAFAQTVLDDATAADARTTLGALSSAAGAVATANLADAVITGLTTVTAVATDFVAISDTSDSGNKKKALISDIVSLLPFTKSFTSSDQTITAAGALTLAHSMAAVPALIQCLLVAQNSVLGYTAGDIMVINPAVNSAGTNTNNGLSIVPDATNVNIRFGSNANTFDILRKDTGASAGVTNTDWKLRVRAWA